MKPIPFNDLWRGHVKSTWGDCLRAWKGVLERTLFLRGPMVEAFEQAYAERVGARYCVAVGSGTQALTLALRAVGVRSRESVWLPAYGAPPSVAAIRAAGGLERFVDVDRATGLATAEAFADPLDDDECTPPRVFMPVHLFGRLFHVEPLRATADRWRAYVIEDAAQGFGLPGVGRYSHAACHSFYPTKNLGSAGDAGAITTDDEGLAEECRALRQYGDRGGWDIERFGWNARMSEVQAAALLQHLKRSTDRNWNRARVAAEYRKRLPEEMLQGWDRSPGPENHHLFPVWVEHREAFRRALLERGVQTAIHYPLALPELKACGGDASHWPVAEKLAATEVSLPCYPNLREHEVGRVCKAATAAYREIVLAP